MSEHPDPQADAERFAGWFPEIYLRFHRRDAKRSELSGASRAVLNHLAMTGPLTVGEAAGHLQRAQSVVSDIVTQLADKGLLERWRDPRDRRRTLVWLTPAGLQLLERDRDVLSVELLTSAFTRMTGAERVALATGVGALLRAAAGPGVVPAQPVVSGSPGVSEVPVVPAPPVPPVPSERTTDEYE